MLNVSYTAVFKKITQPLANMFLRYHPGLSNLSKSQYNNISAKRVFQFGQLTILTLIHYRHFGTSLVH